MTNWTRKAFVALPISALIAVAPGAALAVPAEVTVRVEGATSTIFEGPVTTDGHDVTTATSGTHKCDGTNLGAHPTPGPTSGAALDDASKLGNFTWDGKWFDGFEDFQILRVGPDSVTNTQFWGQFLNYTPSSTGGCQERVATGDESIWVFDAFSKSHALKLNGPTTALTVQGVDVTVVDGGDGSPIAGAEVGGALTDADGRATVSFAQAGIYNLKAERADSVRSNALKLCVDPPGADPCSSGDKLAPSVTVDAPQYASATRSGRFPVSWQGQDGDGSGVASYDVEVRRLDVAGAPFKPLVGRTAAVSRLYGGVPGASYEFRVRARDRAANLGDPGSASTTVPFDDLDRRFRSGEEWHVLKRPNAFHATVSRARTRGATATLRFEGSRIVLIGRELRKGGRLRALVDGEGRTVRLRGRPRHRSVLYRSGELAPGRHTLRLVALGGGPVEIDAVAVLP